MQRRIKNVCFNFEVHGFNWCENLQAGEKHCFVIVAALFANQFNIEFTI